VKRGSLHGRAGVIVARVDLADDWRSRLRGLLLRRPLATDGSEALLLWPCAGIHTIGMRYSLDVAFLDASGAVLCIFEGVRPWRACWKRGAHGALELRAGAARRLGLAVGDNVEWRMQ